MTIRQANRSTANAPVILVVILFLLPVLYVGSYLALVSPNLWISQSMLGASYQHNYRCYSRECEQIFWPLERIDRKLRPGAWERLRLVSEDFIGE